MQLVPHLTETTKSAFANPELNSDKFVDGQCLNGELSV